MTAELPIQHPQLVRHARYRWDAIRQQHQLVFPEGMLVLNESGAAIIRLCDGRSVQEMIAALVEQFGQDLPGEDVVQFLERLAEKGLLRDVHP